MKVFEFHSGEKYYAYSGDTEQKAKNQLFEEIGEMEIDKVKEIPESKWDEKIINSWEDNDFEKEPEKLSIRESIVGDYPQMVYTNDFSTF
jgi:hypothetical protein